VGESLNWDLWDERMARMKPSLAIFLSELGFVGLWDGQDETLLAHILIV
jgi:hypothetical protein